MPTETWKTTSESWKSLIPLKDFNEPVKSKKSPQDMFYRTQPDFNIPLEVIEQWLYPLYQDLNTTLNYGWIDYRNSIFEITEFCSESILNLAVIQNYKNYVSGRSGVDDIYGYISDPADKTSWEKDQTWRVPPIVIDVNSFDKIPKHADIKSPFQLIEGHSRLAYFTSLVRQGFIQRDKHKIYLLKNAQIG